MLDCASGTGRQRQSARERITEVIELADHDILDIGALARRRQEVLDLLDEPHPVRSGWRTWDSLPRRSPSSSSPEDPDPPRSLVLYVPLTTQRRNSPYEVPLARLPAGVRRELDNRSEPPPAGRQVGLVLSGTASLTGLTGHLS